MQVTYVVLSKNHGTRLFPTSAADSLKGNVMPGTVVDTQLVAPLRFEMFLNAHAGIQVCRAEPQLLLQAPGSYATTGTIIC